MKKLILSFALCAALCLGLLTGYASPVLAAEEVIYQSNGLTITRLGVVGSYNSNSRFSEGLACVGVMEYVTPGGAFGSYGFIDQTGKLVIPMKERLGSSSFREGFAAYRTHFIDKTGAEVYGGYEFTSGFSEGLAAVRIDGRWGFIDTTGDLVIPCKYGAENSFMDGLAAVSDPATRKWGFIDKSGNTVIPFEYSSAGSFVGGAAPVSNGEKYGVIDKNGRLIVPYMYDEITWFTSDGTAVVSNKTIVNQSLEYDSGVIDNTGRIVIPLGTYNEIGNFSHGYANVKKYTRNDWGDVSGEELGFIDRTGKMVLQYGAYQYGIYDKDILDGSVFSDGLFVMRSRPPGSFDYKYGLIDVNGNVIIPYEYDDISAVNDGYATALQGNTVYILKFDGQTPAPATPATPTTPTTPTTPATDQPSSWAADAVRAGIVAEIVHPRLRSNYNQPTTRAEFCSLAVALYENVKGEITGRSTFSDTNDVNVQKAAFIGVVGGVGNNRFDPNAQLTREQAAAMLARLAEAVGKPFPKQAAAFADNSAISSWALEAVGQAQAAGIMGGVGDNRFAPKDPYTREQSIVTIMRLFEAVK